MIVRADLVGTLFTVGISAYMSYFTNLNASNIGFSLNMASKSLLFVSHFRTVSDTRLIVAFSSKVFEWVRTLNTLEVAGNRLVHYPLPLLADI